jgi:pyridoxal 5'-phosphate synthase pdxT subunit
MTLPVGVLALQGDFREHLQAFARIGVEAKPVRTAVELAKVSGIVIPGGESTTIGKLARIFDVFEPMQKAIAGGLPAFGTCAGLIMLADRIIDGIEGQETFGGLDVTVQRNAFGNQLDSFETDLMVKGVPSPVHAAFIRAPIITEVGAAEVLATLPDGRIVAVSQGNVLGISFHPEVTGEDSVHELFVREFVK